MNLRLLCAAFCCAALGVAGLAAPKAATKAGADGFISLHPKYPPGYEEHQRWVAHSLNQMHTVKAGMTRAKLDSVFLPEGGLYTSSAQTYLYRECPFFKVRVTFQVLGSGREIPGDPKDKILSISEPVVDTRSQPN